jgi:hypothetical protein
MKALRSMLLELVGGVFQDLVWWAASGALKKHFALQTMQAGSNTRGCDPQEQQTVSLGQNRFQPRALVCLFRGGVAL